MKHLGRLILIFCLALSVPLAYFVRHTYRSLAQEEAAQLRFFAETLFDEMERELALLVRQEEERAVDEYNYFYQPGETPVRSPLSRPPAAPYILGYFQNNPDGSFQTPLMDRSKPAGSVFDSLVDQLQAVNRIFNQKRSAADVFEVQPMIPPPQPAPPREETAGFADRYLRTAKSKVQKEYLGREQKRTEEITVGQALNLARQDTAVLQKKAGAGKFEGRAVAPRTSTPSAALSDRRARQRPSRDGWTNGSAMEPEVQQEAAETLPSAPSTPSAPGRLQAEIDPMQSVFIDQDRILVFRRIALGNQIFRQGLVLRIEPFLNHLAEAHFRSQPLARFTHLDLRALHEGRTAASIKAGAPASSSKFTLDHVFPRPFSFLRARLTCQDIPKSAGRQTLNIMIAVLAGIMLLGLFAIYRSAATVAELSERRSQFVSSVTHELKTPLTNIRMYIEMLEQGIAATPEREQAYFRILGAESGRLSRLINNILEFSKLEKKQLHFNWDTGDFEEVIREVRMIMEGSLAKAGFRLRVVREAISPVRYDREMMIQVLVNLVENSMKFGKAADTREITIRIGTEGKWAVIGVSDRGPGIPRKSLNKIFDDFYRVESALVRATQGTGIGLAFVRKVITAMGGKVSAENNEGAGCTVKLFLPFSPPSAQKKAGFDS